VDRPNIINHKRGPERIIQDEIISFLRIREWYVLETHGNMYQRGFPDLFVCHTSYGQRWVEVKNPLQYCFTAAQMETFPKLCAHGSGVWILTAATQDEYLKLWKPPNWWVYNCNFERVPHNRSGA
jgi:hypothetical protein